MTRQPISSGGMNTTTTPTNSPISAEDQANAQFLDVLTEAHRDHRLFFGEEILIFGHDVSHPCRGWMEIAWNGESARRRGLPRPVPRPEPFWAAPHVGLSGTTRCAGAFLLD